MQAHSSNLRTRQGVPWLSRRFYGASSARRIWATQDLLWKILGATKCDPAVSRSYTQAYAISCLCVGDCFIHLHSFSLLACMALREVDQRLTFDFAGGIRGQKCYAVTGCEVAYLALWQGSIPITGKPAYRGDRINRGIRTDPWLALLYNTWEQPVIEVSLQATASLHKYTRVSTLRKGTAIYSVWYMQQGPNGA